jgi:hypothetical protein
MYKTDFFLKLYIPSEYKIFLQNYISVIVPTKGTAIDVFNDSICYSAYLNRRERSETTENEVL